MALCGRAPAGARVELRACGLRGEAWRYIRADGRRMPMAMHHAARHKTGLPKCANVNKIMRRTGLSFRVAFAWPEV